MRGLLNYPNDAERYLRSAVIWRGTSYGSQSKKGSEFVERILTVTTSLKAQGRNSWDYLSEAIHAKRLGLTAPSILPIPQPQPLSILLRYQQLRTF